MSEMVAPMAFGILMPIALGMGAPNKWAALIWPIAAFVGFGVAMGIVMEKSPTVVAESLRPALLSVVVLGCIGHWVLRPALNWVRIRLAR